MIEKLMRGLGIVVLYGAASVLLAAAMLGAYLWYAWDMSQGKLMKMIAVAQGFDVLQMQADIKDATLAEQMSITRAEVLRERAMQDRNIELQGKAATDVLSQMESEKSRIELMLKEINEKQATFDALQKRLREEAESKGITDLTTYLEMADAELAKFYISDMIEKGEYNRVIWVLRGMEPKKARGIINVFESDTEKADFAKVLRRIGNGEPEIVLADELRKVASTKSFK
jgi:uncharacterized protein YqgQ